MKCVLCKEEAVGSKQFNVIVERVYLCKKHLIDVAELESFNGQDNMKFVGMMKKENEQDYN